MDRLTVEQRKRNMKSVKNRDSDIELLLRKALWEKGYRYQKNVLNIPGKPDIVFKSKKIAIFCDSEFWHGYNWTERKKDFKSHRDFWIPKIERNIERDIEVNNILTQSGWKILRFWGKEIKNDLSGCIKKIEQCLEGD